MKPMGGRTWKYWPASGAVIFLLKFIAHYANMIRFALTIILLILFQDLQATKRQRNSLRDSA